MKRLHRSIGQLAVCWLIGSCVGSDGVVGPPPPAASVAISVDTATLDQGATLQLSATATDESGHPLRRAFLWATSDSSVASVSPEGVVLGLAPGTARITVKSDGKTATSLV